MKKQWIAVCLGLLLPLGGFAKTAHISYSGRSGFMPVASANMDIAVNGKNYHTKFTGDAIGVAAVVGYKMRLDTKGVMGNSTRPNTAIIYTERKGDSRHTEMRFGGDKPSITITPHWSPRSAKEKLNSADLSGSVDPLSVMMRLANQIHLEGKCYGTFAMSDGRSAVRITAKSKGTQTVKLDGYSGKATLCQLGIYPLSGRVMRDVKNRETTYADLYFANISGFERPLLVQVKGKLEGFSVNLAADKIRIK